MSRIIEYAPIGIVNSPFNEPIGMPIQPIGALGTTGSVEVFPEFADGLADLEGFSHIILLYHFHRTNGFCLRIKPFLDKVRRGVFATRAPRRPNGIGLSVLELAGVEDNLAHVRNLDVLNGTPVLDIKPYVPRFDVWPADRIGWFTGQDERAAHFCSDATYETDSGR